MEKKIWMKVEGITFDNFWKVEGVRDGTFSMTLGHALTFNNLSIYPSNRPGAAPQLATGDSFADATFWDKPVTQEERNDVASKVLLADLLNAEIDKFFNKKHFYEINEFFLDRLKLGSYTIFPKKWKAPLRVPIGRLQVSVRSLGPEKVIATIVLGSYFVFYDVPVYPDFDPQKRIRDEKMRKAITDFLLDPEVEDEIELAKRRVSERPNCVLTDTIPGFDKERCHIPDYRFY